MSKPIQGNRELFSVSDRQRLGAILAKQFCRCPSRKTNFFCKNCPKPLFVGYWRLFPIILYRFWDIELYILSLAKKVTINGFDYRLKDKIISLKTDCLLTLDRSVSAKWQTWPYLCEYLHMRTWYNFEAFITWSIMCRFMEFWGVKCMSFATQALEG